MSTDSATYLIRVDGHLDDHWSAWLGELDLTRDGDGTTTITVSVADQAQLHGTLARLRDLGVVLIELRHIGVAARGRRSSDSNDGTGRDLSVAPRRGG
jgi:hypothetical protein